MFSTTESSVAVKKRCGVCLERNEMPTADRHPDATLLVILSLNIVIVYNNH